MHIIWHRMFGSSSIADPFTATLTIFNPCSCILSPCHTSRMPEIAWFLITFFMGSSSISMSGPSSSLSVHVVLASSSSLMTTHPVRSPASCHDRVGCGSLCGRSVHTVHITFNDDFDICNTGPMHLPHSKPPTNAVGQPAVGGKCPRQCPLKKLPDPKVNVHYL